MGEISMNLNRRSVFSLIVVIVVLSVLITGCDSTLPDSMAEMGSLRIILTNGIDSNRSLDPGIDWNIASYDIGT